jgi:hypothetical protein
MLMICRLQCVVRLVISYVGRKCYEGGYVDYQSTREGVNVAANLRAEQKMSERRQAYRVEKTVMMDKW